MTTRSASWFSIAALSLLILILLAIFAVYLTFPSADARATEVGVVNSDYSHLNPGWKSNPDPYYSSRVNATVSLIDDQFPVTILTDADVANLETLKKYDVVVFIETKSMSGAQRIAVREYVASGGKAIFSFAPSRRDYDGYPLIWRVQHPDSWDNSRVWEWGELSEIFQLKFDNDPLFYAGYRVISNNSNHPIVGTTNKELNIDSISLNASENAYNELNFLFPINKNVTPFLWYDMRSNNTKADDVGHLRPAATISRYYKGQMVYFFFKLHDFYWKYGEPERSTGGALMLNTIKYLAGSTETGKITKKPSLNLKTWFTRGKLYINETVRNEGNIQLFGNLNITVLDASGKIALRGTAKNKPLPLPPGNTYTYTSWQYTPRKPIMKGKWRILASYHYFDRELGGKVYAQREQILACDGKTFKVISLGPIKVVSEKRTASSSAF